MKYMFNISRILLGLIFVVFGLNGLWRFATEVCMKLRMSGLRIPVLAVCTLCWPQVYASAQMAPTHQDLSGGEKEEAVAGARVRERVEDLARAIHAKDIDGVMSLYAPNLVSFDIHAPLLYVGAERKRRFWEGAFAAYSGPIIYEFHDLNVTTDGDLAFVHSVAHMKGTLANGQTKDMWVRWTACFRRIDGEWRIVHDHVSVPADLEHGQALVNLTP